MIKKILVLFILILAFISCNKKDDTGGTNPTTTHDPAVVATWDLTAMTQNGNAVNTNTVDEVPVQLTFNSDGSGTVKLSDQGGTPYDGSFTWSTNGSQLTITPGGGSPLTGPYTVNSTTFSFTYVEGSDTYVITYSKSSAATGATVNGTMSLPYPANGHDWGVIIDNDFVGDNGYLYSTMGTAGTSTTINYSIANVTAGTYCLYAVVCQQSQCQGGPQSGDFIGIYGGTLANPPASPNVNVPASGTVTFNLTLEVMP